MSWSVLLLSRLFALILDDQETAMAAAEQNGEGDHPVRLQSLHQRADYIKINVVHRIRYRERTNLNDTDHFARSSHFHQSLEHCSAVNFSEAYDKLFKSLHALASSLQTRISTFNLSVQVPVPQVLWRIILKDLANLYELYSKFLFSSSMMNDSTTNYEYIRSFAAESFAYLLRKIENYQPFIDYLFDWKERDENELESLAMVFSETCQNVQSTFHSCTKSLLLCLLKKLIVKPAPMQPCIKTIYSLLIEHTNQQNVVILWTCLMEGYHAVDNDEKNTVVYRAFYELFQLLVDHRMIIEMKLCWEFLTKVQDNDDEDFLNIHYETVAKLFEQMAVDHQLIETYYRFAHQTSPELLYQQTRKLFHSHLTKKLPNEFYHHLWKHLISKTLGTQQHELIDYLVDFLLIGRKQNEMILLPRDNDQTIREKIDLLQTKKKLLTKEKITEKGVETIQRFVQETLTKIDDTNILVRGQLWRALLLANSPVSHIHVDKLSIQLETHPIPSSTVAITLLELVSRGHSFSTSFWYAQLERAPQSEVYLLCTRVAFLLNPPSTDSFDQFIELLKRNLSSFKSVIRLLSLRILASFPTQPNHVITNCLTCEECPLNVYEYRSKIIYLQKLSVDFLLSNKAASSFHLSMYYLLGLLCSNFTPLWSICIDLVGSYGKKGLEHIGHAYFWSILSEKFQWIQQRDAVQTSQEEITDRLVDEYFQCKDEQEYEINEETIDYIQYRLNLFQILNHFPNECEQKARVLLPIIFDFFSNEYYDHLLSLGLFGQHYSSYIIESPTKITKRLSRKFSVKTLESILSLLKQFHHWQQWSEPQRLYEFYVRLLLSTDNQIQQLAFECLLNYTPIAQSTLQSEFAAHSEKIMPLFQPSACRKTFHELIQGVLLDSSVTEPLKNQFAFLLIRILYSKLNEKRSLGSTTRGRKDYLELNRKYLFQFLVTFASNELYQSHFLFFLQLILEPFSEELFGESHEQQWLSIFQRKISVHAEDDRLTSSMIFIKYLQHSLSLLKTFVTKLGVYVQQQLGYILRFYILTIKFADSLSQQKCTDESIQAKKVRTLLKRLRSMSYRGLQTIFDLFDHSEVNVFKKDLVDDLWLCCVRESYLTPHRSREDIVHVLKLAVVWSRTPYLRQVILGDRQDAKDLVHYSIELLGENIAATNKQLIIEFVWNLTQIDPDDPLLVPHGDRLLTHLTRVSSSMIDASSSISLSIQEFDLPLLLSRRPSDTATTEQLCSIFFRLLRQNVLSKKKKKSAEHDLTCSILKVLQNLIIHLSDPSEKYLSTLPILFCKISQRDQRIELVKLVQALIGSSDSRTSWYLQQLVELNSWNPNQVDEPDYERRLNSYKQLVHAQDIDEDRDEYLCVFYHCLYELEHSNNDLSLREYASQCLHRFLQRRPSYQSHLLTEIRLILKHPSSSSTVRQAFLRHLASLIDLNVDHEDLLDLKRLRHPADLELDFFENISHVQNHRRLRALKRLKTIHDEHAFRSTTIDHYLLPIVCSFINDVINERSQDIHDDIVFQCLTALSRRLSWTKYNQVFISFFRQLKATNRNLNLVQKRCLTRTISAIIDAFHFQVTDDPTSGEGQRITRAIQQRLLPMILDVLSQNSFSIDTLTNSGTATKNATIDEQRQQAVLLTVTCALIATKLIVVFSPDFVEQHIATILLHLIGLLRSRLYSIRDQARDCLSKCMTILGKRYFKFIVEELIAGLQRGYQHFVLLHTIHTLLIHISSLTTPFNIDAAAKMITKVFVDDFFNAEKTESSKANEHENSSYKPSSIPEAKTNKTGNVMELLGRLIQSDDELLICIEPLRQQLSANNDSRQISKCETCLQRFQTGLISNTYLSMETLFRFVFHLMTKTEETQSEQSNEDEKKKKKNGTLTADERSKYHLIPSEPKRGHARVAQAIKHAKKTNLHCLISWTLNLLHKLIKKHKSDEQTFLSMIDPFVGHIEVSLNSQHTDVIVASLRNLSSLLEYSLPSLDKHRVTTMYKKVFDLLKLYSSVTGSSDMNDLLTSGYKILRPFVQRSMNVDMTLSSNE